MQKKSEENYSTKNTRSRENWNKMENLNNKEESKRLSKITEKSKEYLYFKNKFIIKF